MQMTSENFYPSNVVLFPITPYNITSQSSLKGAGMKQWQLQTAKAKLSQLVKEAASTPQGITVRDKLAVVVLSAEDYVRLTSPKRNFAEFMRASPLASADLDLKRDPSEPREVDL